MSVSKWGMYGRIAGTYAPDRFGDHAGHPVPCLSRALAPWFKAQIGSTYTANARLALNCLGEYECYPVRQQSDALFDVS